MHLVVILKDDHGRETDTLFCPSSLSVEEWLDTWVYSLGFESIRVYLDQSVWIESDEFEFVLHSSNYVNRHALRNAFLHRYYSVLR